MKENDDNGLAHIRGIKLRELKDSVGDKICWARGETGFSRKKMVGHPHFRGIFGIYSTDKMRLVEQGDFGKRNDRRELLRFVNGMSEFFNVPSGEFLNASSEDLDLEERKFRRRIRKGFDKKFSDQGMAGLGTPEKGPKADWGEAPDIHVFFGRTQELSMLEEWILRDNCRLVAILGIGGAGKTGLSVRLGRGGIGKTDLSATFARNIGDEFEHVIWRSLLNAPQLGEGHRGGHIRKDRNF